MNEAADTSLDAPPLDGAAGSGGTRAPAAPLLTFARTYHRTSRDAAHYRAVGDAPGRLAMWLAVIVVSWVLLWLTANIVAAVATAVGALFLGAFLRRIWHRVDRAELDRWIDVPGSTPWRERVVCVGSPRELALLARCRTSGEFVDRTFEPEVFAGAPHPAGKRRSWEDRVLALAAHAIPIVAVVAVFSVFRTGWWFWVAFLLPLPDLVRFLTGMLRPRYFRVVPGRLDVLSFSQVPRRSGSSEASLVGPPALSTCSFDLRSHRVVVDLSEACVFLIDLGGGSGTEPKAEFPFGMVKDKMAFAHCVLSAAVSSATPPPLPEDALVG